MWFILFNVLPIIILILAVVPLPIKAINRVARTLLTFGVLFIATDLLMLVLMLVFGDAAIGISIGIGGTLFVALFITIWHIAPKLRRRRIFAVWGILTAAVLCFGLVFTGIDSMLEIDEPVETSLARFVPYEENGNLAVLDEEPIIDFDENYPLPKIDGATALYPYYAAVFQAVYPEDEYKNSDYLNVSNSTGAYYRFIDDQTGTVKPDIIFLAGLNDWQVETTGRLEMNIEQVPIAKEAFVFIVNRYNRVDSVTVNDLKNIYSGQIDNWKDLGGYNNKIKLYMLVGENMGSNVAFNRYIGDFNADYIEGRYENISLMEGMSRSVADYKNYRSSLGYSYRYYIETMTGSDAIKMLAIDGISPTPENIRSNAYPFTGEFVAIYSKNNPNPNVKILIDFMLSEQGQELVEKTGYVALN
jgi:phosphate transport system substrate-binding protein